MTQSGGRRRRLAEELEESGLALTMADPLREMLLEEVDFALRPFVHERRVQNGGTILDPLAPPESWAAGTQLDVWHSPVNAEHLGLSRRFVDGMSSWLIRHTDGQGDEWALFDRPAGSERDLVVLADVFEATIVQRHPSGVVRVVGDFGVLRWEGIEWHHEPPVSIWADTVADASFLGDAEVVEALLRLAVHDLGSLGVGALLIYRPDPDPRALVEERLPTPPPLRIRSASQLAPLRHALAHVDGAAVFDGDGVLRHLGVLLIPSPDSEKAVEAIGGARHTAGRRYSHDDPSATVIVVSEDGPVSVLRDGAVLDRPAR